MGNKISVTTTPKNRVLINTGGSSGIGVDTLRKLKDVDATSLNNNEILVYDESTGKFIIEELPVINGGEF